MKNIERKFAAALIVMALIAMNFPSYTLAYFSDSETSDSATLTAGTLDIVSGTTLASLGIAAGANSLFSADISDNGSVPFQYGVGVEKTSCSDSLFASTTITAKLGDTVAYSGPLASFGTTTATTTLGEWTFRLAPAADAVSGTCSFDLVFPAWQQNVAAYGDAGWTDSETIAVTMIVSGATPPAATGVVLNEIDPNPSSGDEWVELYNNNATPVDIAGWQISEISGGKNGNEQIYDITATSSTDHNVETTTGTTIIGGHGFLVIDIGKNKLNNDGDTVRLYDSTGTKLDEKAFDDTTKDKSIARIPDGIGTWVDPIPTPGMPNELALPDPLLISPLAALLNATTSLALSTSTPSNSSSTPATSDDEAGGGNISSDESADPVIVPFETAASTSTAATSTESVDDIADAGTTTDPENATPPAAPADENTDTAGTADNSNTAGDTVSTDTNQTATPTTETDNTATSPDITDTTTDTTEAPDAPSTPNTSDTSDAPKDTDTTVSEAPAPSETSGDSAPADSSSDTQSSPSNEPAS